MGINFELLETAPEVAIDKRLIVIGTMLVQIGVGSLYAWSIFNMAVSTHLGLATVNTSTGKLVASPSVVFTFSLACLSLSLSTIIASPLVKRFGIRKVIIAAGAFFALALIIAAFSVNIVMLWLFGGILLGAMNGIAYISTLSNVIKWFPEKKGLVSGISVACYGLGSFIFKWIDQYIASGNIISGVINSENVTKTFIFGGIIAGIVIIGGALLIEDAPLLTEVKTSYQKKFRYEFSTKEMLQTPQAYMMFFLLFTASLSLWFVGAGITIIGATKTGLDASSEIILDVVAFISLANMVGRLLFGIISDRLGCKAVFFMTYMATLFVILWVILSPDGQMPITSFYSVAFISAACFGGNITVFPTWVADYFGLKNHTWNYSLIYQGFGIASLVAGIIFSGGNPLNPQKSGNISGILWTMMVMFLISIFIFVIIQKPQKTKRL